VAWPETSESRIAGRLGVRPERLHSRVQKLVTGVIAGGLADQGAPGEWRQARVGAKLIGAGKHRLGVGRKFADRLR
jgi:hypothetical protein